MVCCNILFVNSMAGRVVIFAHLDDHRDRIHSGHT